MGTKSGNNPREYLARLIKEQAYVRASERNPIIGRGTLSRPAWLFDFRTIMLQSRALNAFADLFWETYADQYPFQVAGPETIGIALMAAIVMKGEERGTPINGLFIRKARKKDGLMKYVEGKPTADPVIIVDDIVNSGQTFHKHVGVLLDHGVHVSDAFAILAFRDLAAFSTLRDRGVTLRSIFTLEDFYHALLQSTAPEVPTHSFDIRWRFSAGNPSHQFVVPKSAPAVDEMRLYIGSDDGYMYALDKKTGSVVWRFAIGAHPDGKGIFSSPAVWNGTVYFGGYDGSVYAIDAQTGEKRWQWGEVDWIGSSPSLAPALGLLFIGLEYALPGSHGGIVALKLDSGEKVWDALAPGLSHSSPLYVEKEGSVVIGCNDGIVRCYDAASGRECWQYQTGGEVKASFVYDAKRRLVCFGSFDSYFYAVSALDGSLAFRFKTGESIFSTPCIREDAVYVTSLDKYCYALSLETGKELWRFETGGRVFASPVIFDESLWVGSNSGRLHELDPKTGVLRSFLQLSERIVNAVAYDEGQIYVPTAANEVYAIQKR